MRAFTAAVSLLALPLALAQSTSPKRGIVYVETENSADDHYWSTSNSDVTWYYNYQASPTSNLKSSGLQFVPMLFGAGSNYQNFYTTVKSLIDGGQNITYALGFNEPDGCKNGGSCIDAQTAAETWIAQMEPLRKLGVKLGSPAVTGTQTGFQWLQNFFTQCAGQCHVDFMTVHWYGDFQGLASQVGQMNGTYQNISSIWVTEYNDPNVALSVTQDFYNETTAFLDRVPYIQRYSMFGSFRSSVSNVGPNGAMLTQNGQLTDIGAWYLGQKATGNIPQASDAAKSAKIAGLGMGLIAISVWWLA